MDDGGRLWTIIGFYAGLRAVCAVAEGLTEFCGEMPDFTAQCQTFDHFFGFCRAAVGGGILSRRGGACITRRFAREFFRAGCKIAKKRGVATQLQAP